LALLTLRFLFAMSHTARIFRIDAEVLNIRIGMRGKDDPASKIRLEELLARRAAILWEMERKARQRVK
jgi:hypothetical protein